MLTRLCGSIPEPLKAPFRRFAGRPHLHGIEWRDRRLLESSERYVPGTFPLFGKPFAYADSASFLSAHEEIFVRGIYSFRSDSDRPFIIDGGANVGLATLFFKRQYPAAEVLALEADPLIAEVLERNIGSFGLGGVELRREALWDRGGTVRFAADGADGGRAGESEEAGFEVPAVRLSEVIGERRVDLLKLDIEGAETRVLVEAETALARVERLFVEYHAPSGKPGSLSALLAVLERSGFRTYLEQTCVFLRRPLLDEAATGPFESQINVFGWRCK
jgi:FkbM family methyltransferase